MKKKDKESNSFFNLTHLHYKWYLAIFIVLGIATNVEAFGVLSKMKKMLGTWKPKKGDPSMMPTVENDDLSKSSLMETNSSLRNGSTTFSPLSQRQGFLSSFTARFARMKAGLAKDSKSSSTDSSVRNESTTLPPASQSPLKSMVNDSTPSRATVRLFGGKKMEDASKPKKKGYVVQHF